MFLFFLNKISTLFIKNYKIFNWLNFFKAFFPGLVHVAYVLRPVGFFQKAISEVSNKLFREDFKFRVIVLANVIELHEFIDKDQLTDQLGGDLPYCHHTWIQNRIVMSTSIFHCYLHARDHPITFILFHKHT